MIGDTTTSQYVNSPVVTVSFEVLDADWYLIQQSNSWKRIQSFLAESGSKGIQMSQKEKLAVLEGE